LVNIKKRFSKHNSIEIKINKVEYLPSAARYKGIAGSIVAVDAGAFFVKTLDSFIKITEWSGYLRPRIGDRLK
jgi:methionyl-tRNA formyltransferase